jgi:hypothetical protein
MKELPIACELTHLELEARREGPLTDLLSLVLGTHDDRQWSPLLVRAIE